MNKICDLLNFARHGRRKREGEREGGKGAVSWHRMPLDGWLRMARAGPGNSFESSRDEPSETFPRFTVADKRASEPDRATVGQRYRLTD